MQDIRPHPIDLAAAMARFDGDLPFFRELLDEFLAVLPERVRLIEEAAARGDGARVRNIAHGIRGAAGNLGAGSISALARAIEELGAGIDVDGPAAHVEALRREIARIEQYAGAIK